MALHSTVQIKLLARWEREWNTFWAYREYCARTSPPKKTRLSPRELCERDVTFSRVGPSCDLAPAVAHRQQRLYLALHTPPSLHRSPTAPTAVLDKLNVVGHSTPRSPHARRIRELRGTIERWDLLILESRCR